MYDCAFDIASGSINEMTVCRLFFPEQERGRGRESDGLREKKKGREEKRGGGSERLRLGERKKYRVDILLLSI